MNQRPASKNNAGFRFDAKESPIFALAPIKNGLEGPQKWTPIESKVFPCEGPKFWTVGFSKKVIVAMSAALSMSKLQFKQWRVFSLQLRLPRVQFTQWEFPLHLRLPRVQFTKHANPHLLYQKTNPAFKRRASAMYQHVFS